MTLPEVDTTDLAWNNPYPPELDKATKAAQDEISQLCPATLLVYAKQFITSLRGCAQSHSKPPGDPDSAVDEQSELENWEGVVDTLANSWTSDKDDWKQTYANVWKLEHDRITRFLEWNGESDMEAWKSLCETISCFPPRELSVDSDAKLRNRGPWLSLPSSATDMAQYQEMFNEVPKCFYSVREPRLEDNCDSYIWGTNQDKKDCQRDSFVIGGSFYGGFQGYDALIEAVKRVLETANANSTCRMSQSALRCCAQFFIHQVGRTHSAWQAYSVCYNVFNSGDVVIVADSASAAPCHIDVVSLGSAPEHDNYAPVAILRHTTEYRLESSNPETTELPEELRRIVISCNFIALTSLTEETMNWIQKLDHKCQEATISLGGLEPHIVEMTYVLVRSS